MHIEHKEFMGSPSVKSQYTYQDAMEQFEIQFGAESAVALLTEFVEAMNEIMHDLDFCVEQKDAEKVKRLTHRVIGLCPMYSAKPTADLSQAMENEMKDGNWESVAALNRSVRASFDAYMQEH